MNICVVRRSELILWTHLLGLSGLMNGFSTESNDEEFRPFIRRLPGWSTLYTGIIVDD